MTPIHFGPSPLYCKVVGEAVTAFVDNLTGAGDTDEGKATALQSALDHLHTQFYARVPALDYGSPINRAAYLYCYVPALATACERTLTESKLAMAAIKSKVESEGELRVFAIGGGPGTELLALSKLLVSQGWFRGPVNVEFQLLDQVGEWAATLSQLKIAINKQWDKSFGRKNRPLHLSTNIIVVDACAGDSLISFAEPALSSDIYIANYFLSELAGNWEESIPLFKHLVHDAPPEAVFVLIDRAQSTVEEHARELFDAVGLMVEESAQLKAAERLDPLEQFSDLGKYFDLMDRGPQAGMKRFYLIGRRGPPF